MMRLKDFNESTLSRDLQDPKFATGYLMACLEESKDVFLIGIHNVAKVLGGVEEISHAASLSHESLFSSVADVLDKLGFELMIKPKI